MSISSGEEYVKEFLLDPDRKKVVHGKHRGGGLRRAPFPLSSRPWLMNNVHFFTRAEVLGITPAIIYSHPQNKVTKTDQILARNSAKTLLLQKQQTGYEIGSTQNKYLLFL
jgi:hypothetical protein